MPRVRVLAGGQWKAPNTTPVNPSGGGLFSHPGVVYSGDQLAYVAGRLAANAQPWTSRYNNLMSTTASGGANSGRAFSSTAWTASPLSVVSRGADGSSVGETDLQNDSTAALVHALAWVYKGDRTRASKSAQILNAWSSTLTEIRYSTAPNLSDGKLLSGWTSTRLARAAEIIRHTGYVAGPGETPLDSVSLENCFVNVFVPLIINGHTGGAANWLMTFCDGLVQMGVFCEDLDIMDAGIKMWRDNIAACFWMPGDTNRWAHFASSTPPSSGLPVSPAGGKYDKASADPVNFRVNYWRNPQSWPAGLPQELGRDLHHTGMIFAACSYAAETCWHQGRDLYGEQQTRLVTAVELFSRLVYDRYVRGINPPPGWPFSGAPSGAPTAFQRATLEAIYNHYSGRLQLSMPNTANYLNQYGRNHDWDVDVFAVAEQLTFQGTP